MLCRLLFGKGVSLRLVGTLIPCGLLFSAGSQEHGERGCREGAEVWRLQHLCLENQMFYWSGCKGLESEAGVSQETAGSQTWPAAHLLAVCRAPGPHTWSSG